MRILSLCTSAGLWDKAWLEAGHEVVPGCELIRGKRDLYRAFCGGQHICCDIKDLPGYVRGEHFDGVIGGIPCQSRSRLRAIKPPKFPDLLVDAMAVLYACTWDWCIFENVRPLAIPGFLSHKMNAMNYGQPHQSRERFFTCSPNIDRPEEPHPGTCDDLMAYSIVAGRIYGPKRGARLMGWPKFADLDFPCAQLQEALADGVPRCLADAWIAQIAKQMA